MFSKLKQQNINNKIRKSPTPQTKSKSPKKRSNSYSAIQRKKLNDSQLFDYEIGWICDHLYQGCFYKNKKHGQGLLIQSNGTIALGNWNHGVLNGYALFITPFGGKIHVNYKDGKLDGWGIVQYANNFQILQFSRDSPQPLRRRYDQSEQLWTEALFSPNGKIEKILKIQKVQDFKLASFITDPQLLKFYDDIIMKGESKLITKRLNVIKINDKFQYYGYTNDSKIPEGLGIIYSCNQIYAGNFKSGSLDQYGLILFPNGVIYKGQIFSGKIWGDGVIYDTNFDETKTVKVCQQGIEYVIDEEQGFNLDIVSFQIGKIPKMPAQKGYNQIIDKVCQQMTKYYFRTNSSYVVQETPEQSLYSVSVKNSGKQDQLKSKSSKSDKNSKKQSEKQNERKGRTDKRFTYISDNSSVSNESVETSKKPLKYNNNDLLINQKLTYLQQFTKKPEQKQSKEDGAKQKAQSQSKEDKLKLKPQLDSLQISEMSQVKPIIGNTTGQMQGRYNIPSKTPTFEQISKKDKSMQTKISYPYLLQFQIGKNVFAPYKMSNIGRIVANSLKIAEKYY